MCRAVASFVAGDAAQARARLEAVLAAHPEQLSALAVQAQMLARSGQREAALGLLDRVIARFPDYPGAQALLGALLLPGPHYRDVLAKLHSELAPRAYLEIGVDTGATLALAGACNVAIGIDPAEIRPAKPLPACVRLFRATSDAFFAAHTADEVLGSRRLDFVFIDGMHRFENALADFDHAEGWSNPSGTIVFHDCLPLHPVTASRERRSSFWVGDTWKVVIALRSARPELRIRTIPCAPSGLVVVRGLNPDSKILSARREELLQRFGAIGWERPLGDFPPDFSLVGNDATGIRAAIT
ncbi:MAG TPA: class I SAM-dependent methyltransferase [Polyangiaceae bacterium]|nr:class I SAM-dependent methyltransferase [Polyangiaceae bacterium]